MHGHISFVPEVLPIAPRPIAGELISSWLLRVSFANRLTTRSCGKPWIERRRIKRLALMVYSYPV